MRFTLLTGMEYTNAQVICLLVKAYEGLLVFEDAESILADIKSTIGKIIKEGCTVLWIAPKGDWVELGLDFKGWNFTPVILVKEDGTVVSHSSSNVNKEGIANILRKPYASETKDEKERQ